MRRLHHLGNAAQELAHEAKLLAFNPPDWLVHPLVVIPPFVIAWFSAWQGAFGAA
jgi:hypothetical protein